MLDRPIQRSSNFLFRTSVILRAKCAGHPTCWYHINCRMSSRMSSSDCGSTSLRKSKYLALFRIPAQKYGPIIRLFRRPHHRFTDKGLCLSTSLSQCGFSEDQQCMLRRIICPWFVNVASSVNSTLVKNKSSVCSFRSPIPRIPPFDENRRSSW